MGRSNLTLIYDNYADRATLSGGAWRSGTLALANLQTPYFAEVARSSSTAPASTQFRVDLGRPFIIGGLAFGPCNVRPSAETRIRAYFDSAGTQLAYDSGVLPFPGTRVESVLLDWEDEGFWDGTSKEFDDLFKGVLCVHVPPLTSAQYWQIEIFDEGNPAGYIDIGRLFMGKAWSPDYNYTYDNNSLDLEALTDVEEGRSGVRFYNARNLRRTFNFGFPYLPDVQTFRDVYRIATRSGRHNQVVVIPNPSDPDSLQREAFIGTLGQLPSLRRVSPGMAGASFTIEETL